MRSKILTRLAAIGLMAAATSPALAQTWYSAGPDYFYQGPDGSYDTYGDLSRSIRGVPCGVECTQHAAARWGLAPSQRRPEIYGFYH